MTKSDIDYFASPALSKSRIDLLLECPARYKADLDGDVEEKDSDALRFGSLTHLLTLEPEEFDSQYAVTDLSLATKEGKAFKKDAEDRGLEIIKGKDLEKAMFMADAVREHWQCHVLFENPRLNLVAQRDSGFLPDLPVHLVEAHETAVHFRDKDRFIALFIGYRQCKRLFLRRNAEDRFFTFEQNFRKNVFPVRFRRLAVKERNIKRPVSADRTGNLFAFRVQSDLYAKGREIIL